MGLKKNHGDQHFQFAFWKLCLVSFVFLIHHCVNYLPLVSWPCQYLCSNHIGENTELPSWHRILFLSFLHFLLLYSFQSWGFFHSNPIVLYTSECDAIWKWNTIRMTSKGCHGSSEVSCFFPCFVLLGSVEMPKIIQGLLKLKVEENFSWGYVD